MKKNNKKKLHRNLFFTLMKNNIIRGIIGFILLSIMLILLVVVVLLEFIDMPSVRLELQAEQLKKGVFEEVNFGELSGWNGNIEVLNSDFEVVFPDEIDTVYTYDEIHQITPIEFAGSEFEVFFYESNGQMLTRYDVIIDDKHCYLTVDEKGNYVDSYNFNLVQESYTVEELEYIQNEYLETSLLFRYDFKTNDGEEHILLFHLDSPIIVVSDNTDRMLTIGLILSVVVYIGFMIWSIRSVSRKIKKPLDVLDEAMNSFSNGDYDKMLDYKAVNEISNVIDTFNEMVERLNNSKAANKKLLEERERLIANIAHDLKTPITITRGYTKALMDGKINEEDKHQYYEKIYNKTTELNDLISVFANYSKLNHPDFKLDSVVVDLAEFVRDYLANNYSYLVGNGYQVSINISNDELHCSIDPVHFKRALDNIISNFIKYSDAETLFEFEVESTIDYCRIYLENNGSLIEPAVVGGLFKPFTMGDQSRTSNESSGLGLATTQRIVELHNGTIEYKQTTKNVFIISIPLV